MILERCRKRLKINYQMAVTQYYADLVIFQSDLVENVC